MRRSKRAGFTAIELLVVLGLIGLVAAVAVPLFQRYSGLLKAQAAAGALAQDLQLARALAARRGRPVVVTFGGAGYNLAFLQPDGNRRTVKVVDWSREFPNVVLEPPSGVTEIRFDNRGFVVPSRGAPSTLVFTVRHRAGVEQVVVNPLGRVSRGS